MEQDTSYNKIKRATNEELAEMWTQYFADHENKELRDALILQYIYLTRYVVGRVKVALPPTFSYEDISSYGVEGLIDAVEKFTPKMGARFETYALVRIRGNIIDKIRSQDFLPRSVRRKIKDVKEAQEELKNNSGVRLQILKSQTFSVLRKKKSNSFSLMIQPSHQFMIKKVLRTEI